MLGHRFLRIRATWYHADEILQIDDLGGRMRVSLSSGLKLDIDPIEGEKIARQLEDHGLSQAKGFDHSAIALLVGRLASLENTLSNMKAKISSLESALDGERKAKQKVAL